MGRYMLFRNVLPRRRSGVLYCASGEENLVMMKKSVVASLEFMKPLEREVKDDA